MKGNPINRGNLSGWRRAALALIGSGLLAGMSASAQVNYVTPYTFVTIAGSVTNGANVDGTGSAAGFVSPTGLTIDGNGNLYTVDQNACTVRKLTPSGTNWIVTTIAGTVNESAHQDGTNANAWFDAPTGITCDHLGNLYVVDSSSTVRKMTPSGTNWAVTTIAGSPYTLGSQDGTNAVAQFWAPYGIAVDAAGNLYVADTGNSTIRKLVQTGTNWVVTTIAGTPSLFGGYADGTNQTALFNTPEAITIDPNGTLFVADSLNSAIRKMVAVGTNWVVTTPAGIGGLAFGFVDGTNRAAEFNDPYGITVDSQDTVFVGDTYNNAIRKVAAAGTNWVVSTVAGDPNGNAGVNNGSGAAATFNQPWGLCVDASGAVYVADTVNHVIRKGTLTVVAVPNLTISLGSPNTVLVSWPGTGLTLQTTANLAAPSWSPYSGNIATVNGTNIVTLSAPAGNLFFRLSNP